MNNKIIYLLFAFCLLSCDGEEIILPTENCEIGEIDKKVILIFVDDLGIDDTQLFNQNGVHLPNIEALQKDGVSFTNAYIASSICSPSRAALLTGQYPQRFGFENNAHSNDPIQGVPTSVQLISERFKEHGYYNGIIGKWHLGEAQIHNPLSRGFHYFLGHLKGTLTYASNPNELICGSLQTANQFELFEDQTLLSDYEYSTDLFTDQSVQFIENNGSRDFFLYLSYNSPHTPLQTTSKYYDQIDNNVNRDQKIYYSMIKAIDEGVGRIVKKLKEKQIYEKTTVVFLSDNGCNRRLGYCNEINALRDGKASLYEGGIRTSLVFKSNKFNDKGIKYNGIVSSLDIAATLFDVNCPDTEIPEFSGLNLSEYVNENKSTHRALFWRLNGSKAILHEGFKWIENENGEELYELQDDAFEEYNLLEEEQEIKRNLREKYSLWEDKVIKAKW